MTLQNHPVSLSGKRLEVPLSQLIGRKNPRRTQPERDAHRRLVASIRAQGLLEPLVIGQRSDDTGGYPVIAGKRRLAALRDIYKGKDPKVSCSLRPVEGDAADAVALAENFAREPMHPLDEAEAFAHLAKDDGKGAEDIAAQFGVTPGYVRQRMKLSALAEVIKAAYREGGIDTATAEAFAAVPEEKQVEVWREVRGQPQHAEHVRNIIANAWVDAKHALFDIAFLPPEAVSRDLFGDRVLVERQAFFGAQAEALIAQQKVLQEEGWSDVVIAPHNDVHERLWRMDEAPESYDEDVTKKLAKLDRKREELDAQWEKVADDDETATDALQEKLDKLDEQAAALTKSAAVQYAEPVKAVGTVFLILDPDGQVRRQYRGKSVRGGRGNGDSTGVSNGVAGAFAPPAPPTLDDVSDKQKATLFTHQAIAVRAALLEAPLARKRVLVMILHQKVRSEALAVRHDANGTTLHAENAEGFTSPALEKLRQKHAELVPFQQDAYVEEANAYACLGALSEPQLDALIDLLTVECLTAHLQRRTELVRLLADELKVEVRQEWRPDAAWLASYQKLQLARLIGDLRGPAYANAAEKKKKSELVQQAAVLFADAAEGRLTDPALAQRVNQWLPSGVLTEVADQETQSEQGRRAA